jgi:hypothetical protein
MIIKVALRLSSSPTLSPLGNADNSLQIGEEVNVLMIFYSKSRQIRETGYDRPYTAMPSDAMAFMAAGIMMS